MISRRAWLGTAVGAMLGADSRILEVLSRLAREPLLEREIPRTGEMLPVIGLGSADSFSEMALRESRTEEYRTIRAVLQALVDGGGAVFDTAYAYGASEQVAGQVAEELGLADDIWWSTKVNAARVAGGTTESADLAQTRYQIRRSFLRLRRQQIDLMQVHNMGDPVRQLALLKELKAVGYVRYIGVTTTFAPQYAGLAEVMRNEPIDFIGIEYAVDQREAEELILPLAVEREIGVLAYMPFGRGRMWARIGDRPVPEWAGAFDAHSWAQIMLKFVLAHPGVTVACPGTSDPVHMVDNLGAGIGRLPDADERERILDLVQGLPEA
jgi:aryl-alcohol dehydrogenase-like predicted oxidoreductase